MNTIRLTIAFDGTAYVGWQRQTNGLSVQQLIENALAQVLGETVVLHSSGRTDAGVHALGMVAHFRTERNLPLAAYREGVNRLLPRDVAVQEVFEATGDFHARFSARGKWYRYALYQGEVCSPLLDRTAWHLRETLDWSAVEAAARFFVGKHDFAAFRSSGCEAKGTVKEIYAIDLLREGELMYINVRGSGFLRNMVRVMVGTLVEIGMRKRPVADIGRLLAEGDRCQAGRTAPPRGLCLMEVWY
jgi:tRNA pseudouridine38-40 synthase